MRKLKFNKTDNAKEVHFIKLCTLGVAAIFAITVLITVIAVNMV